MLHSGAAVCVLYHIAMCSEHWTTIFWLQIFLTANATSKS